MDLAPDPRVTQKAKPSDLIGRGLIAAGWLVLLVLLAAVALEFRFRSGEEAAKHLPARPHYDRLEKAYQPFTIQHINPHYLFFFPFDPSERAALSNDVVTIHPEGFRGRGPEARGNRKLAFIVGGSAAFGHFASHDSTTIAGYLNALQTQYFFVNAAVPSWNSTQELFRVANQILEFHPSLVLAYDGTNDVVAMRDYYYKELNYPPGTPESFDELYSLVGDIRAGHIKPQAKPWYRRFFPHLTGKIRGRLGMTRHRGRSGPVEPQVIEAAARKYVHNLDLMNDLCRAHGARFAGFFQPRLSLHEHVPENLKKGRGEFKDFHDLVFTKYRPEFEYYDLSKVFDKHFDQVPALLAARNEDLTPETIFVDVVHLTDRGNRLVAREILEALARGLEVRE